MMKKKKMMSTSPTGYKPKNYCNVFVLNKVFSFRLFMTIFIPITDIFNLAPRLILRIRLGRSKRMTRREDVGKGRKW